MNNKSGWFYVGEGLLRYRDEGGWTEHFLEAESVRGFDGPPPPPGVSRETKFNAVGAATSLERGSGVGVLARTRRLARRGRQRGR
ncbi:MAG: hypothetical protein ACTHJJ_13310 [Intrasporangium sp.]|uniref:hypothetical protein n=1 Tax=Intrasporangium sp. TaxID=1925024 RepID=UPI003F7D37C4